MIPAIVVLNLLSPYGLSADMATFSVSAYTDASGVPPFGITASGWPTRDGVCACGPSYPFGTVFIVGDRAYICRDRGGAIDDGRLDLWTKRESDALRWGRRSVPAVVVIGGGGEQR